MPTKTSLILVDKVADWLREQMVKDAGLEEIVRGCCERLAATGMPLARANMSFSVLHPLYRAVGFTWLRGQGLTVQGYRHIAQDQDEETRFTASPYYYMLKHDLDLLHRRIDRGDDGAIDFPVFAELKQQGLTDYLAFRAGFSLASGRGLIGSWCTDQPSGFSENDIAALLRIQDRLAMAAKMAVETQLTASMLNTYLGADAGGRVLRGQVQRGDGETLKAAMVMADMRNSTQLAEKLGRQAYIEVLNAFFDNVASAFADAGGEILSYVGDGFLAIFPCANSKAERTKACRTAHIAALNAVERMRQANAARAAENLEHIGYGIGLHIGKVMYGNVGLPDRLTFSVFGPSVNMVTRLESLTKKHKVPIIASEDFQTRCECEWQLLGEEHLRGIDEPVHIYTPTRCDQLDPSQLIKRNEYTSSMSDAEVVELLHRDSRQA